MASPCKSPRMAEVPLALLQHYECYVNSAWRLLEGDMPVVSGAVKLLRQGDKLIVPQLHNLLRDVSFKDGKIDAQKQTIISLQKNLKERKEELNCLQKNVQSLKEEMNSLREMLLLLTGNEEREECDNAVTKDVDAADVSEELEDIVKGADKDI